MDADININDFTYQINGADSELLKAAGIKVGLLINFKHPKADIKRMVLGSEV